MRIRVEYFIDDDQVDKSNTEIERDLAHSFKATPDYQHGEITVCADKTVVEDCIDVQIYWKDCEHSAQTRRAVQYLQTYIRDYLLL